MPQRQSSDPRDFQELILALRERGVQDIHQWRDEATDTFRVEINFYTIGRTMERVVVGGLDGNDALENALLHVQEFGYPYPTPPNPNFVE